jgi:hypothetical protein
MNWTRPRGVEGLNIKMAGGHASLRSDTHEKQIVFIEESFHLVKHAEALVAHKSFLSYVLIDLPHTIQDVRGGPISSKRLTKA